MSTIALFISLLAGIMLGGAFYGGLWFTVRRLPLARHPALLALASFWIRSALALASFVFLMKEGWQYGLISLAGFTLARLAIAKFYPDKRPATKCT